MAGDGRPAGSTAHAVPFHGDPQPPGVLVGELEREEDRLTGLGVLDSGQPLVKQPFETGPDSLRLWLFANSRVEGEVVGIDMPDILAALQQNVAPLGSLVIEGQSQHGGRCPARGRGVFRAILAR